jgi:hypothetical protein
LLNVTNMWSTDFGGVSPSKLKNHPAKHLWVAFEFGDSTYLTLSDSNLTCDRQSGRGSEARRHGPHSSSVLCSASPIFPLPDACRVRPQCSAALSRASVSMQTFFCCSFAEGAGLCYFPSVSLALRVTQGAILRRASGGARAILRTVCDPPLAACLEEHPAIRRARCVRV